MSVQNPFTVPVLHTAPSKVLEANNLRTALRLQNTGPTNFVRIKFNAPPGESDVDEVQTLTVAPAPAGGTFKLKYGALSTIAMAHNVSAGTMQTNLRALDGLGSVTVSGSMAAGYTITLVGVQLPTKRLEVTENSLAAAATDPVQTINPAAAPESGSLRVKRKVPHIVDGKFMGFKEQLSPAIPYNATANDIRDVLRRLYNDGRITTSGTFATACAVTFTGMAKPIELMEIVESTLRAVTEEVQILKFDTVPDAGEFKLKFGDLETAAIAFDDNAAAIQVALRLLAGLGSVTVTGDMENGFTITFVAQYGFKGNVAPLEVTENSLVLLGDIEVQLVEFSTEPNQGSFKITVPGYGTSAAILTTDDDTAVQVKLRAIHADLDAITVSGDFTTGFEITFTGVNGNVAPVTFSENTLETATREEQLIEFSAVPDVGSFSLVFGLLETDLIPHDAAAAAVQDALRELEGLELVTVSGDFTAGFTVVFVGVEGDQALIEEGENTLENTSTPVTITVTEDQAGDDDVAVDPSTSTTTPGVADTPVPGLVDVEDNNAVEGAYQAPMAVAVENTTPGVAAVAGVPSVALTTPYEDAEDGLIIAADGVLLLEGDLCPRGEVYALADTATISLEVVESIG